MDKNPAVLFIVDGISRHGLGDHMHGMPAADQLGTLREGLTFGTALKRMEVAHDVADAQWSFRVVSHEMPELRRLKNQVRGRSRSFLKWG